MAYRIKFLKQIKNNFIQGISLIEILLVLAIFTIMFAVSSSAYSNFQAAGNLKITTDSIIESLRYAESSSQIGKNNSTWGVKVFNTQAVIFNGINYATRDTSKDQIIAFPKGINVSGLSEIVFIKITGATTNIGTITATNSSGSKNININAKGTITY